MRPHRCLRPARRLRTDGPRIAARRATASQFAAALQTARGREIAARLAAAGRQLGFLTGEVREAAEDLAATVAVLPPHRTPQPHLGQRPAVQTTAPAAPAPASTPAPCR
ncbi:hypothetical protein [Streptomyces sp. CMB-StM0423]|uniref:hypothetical protein n=1 Tax=Streptomyces sp. CMB-StM0423 TaxID=2059884 RepID=UPI000C6FF8E7|nr:hypothetical protein CXR04_09920 [Streptomyces sp. CMB-StM0423]